MAGEDWLELAKPVGNVTVQQGNNRNFKRMDTGLPKRSLVQSYTCGPWWNDRVAVVISCHLSKASAGTLRVFVPLSGMGKIRG